MSIYEPKSPQLKENKEHKEKKDSKKDSKKKKHKKHETSSCSSSSSSSSSFCPPKPCPPCPPKPCPSSSSSSTKRSCSSSSSSSSECKSKEKRHRKPRTKTLVNCEACIDPCGKSSRKTALPNAPVNPGMVKGTENLSPGQCVFVIPKSGVITFYIGSFGGSQCGTIRLTNVFNTFTLALALVVDLTDADVLPVSAFQGVETLIDLNDVSSITILPPDICNFLAEAVATGSFTPAAMAAIQSFIAMMRGVAAPAPV